MSPMLDMWAQLEHYTESIESSGGKEYINMYKTVLLRVISVAEANQATLYQYPHTICLFFFFFKHDIPEI